ncbi:MAG: DUF4142 domain-containing protein [Gemmatimonadaceae bacterium]
MEKTMNTRKHALLSTLCAVALLAACEPRDTAMDDTLGGRMDTAAGVTDLTREYTEAELLGLIDLANDGTIEMGKMAQTTATNAEVKSLAGKAVEGHTELARKGTELASRLNLTLVVPDADEDLADNHRKWMEHLTGMTKGVEWDRAYLDHEIERHRTILDEVKDALGRTQNPDVRTYLEEVRTHIEGHIGTYEQVKDKLS